MENDFGESKPLRVSGDPPGQRTSLVTHGARKRLHVSDLPSSKRLKRETSTETSDADLAKAAQPINGTRPTSAAIGRPLEPLKTEAIPPSIFAGPSGRSASLADGPSAQDRGADEDSDMPCAVGGSVSGRLHRDDETMEQRWDRLISRIRDAIRYDTADPEIISLLLRRTQNDYKTAPTGADKLDVVRSHRAFIFSTSVKLLARHE